MSKINQLMKHLNKTSADLSEENKEIFKDITVYIRSSFINSRDAEEFLQQILDSFLNAESRNITIEEMLGTSDIKEYCEEIVNTYKSSYSILSQTKINSIYIVFLGSILIFISILNYIEQIFNTLDFIETFKFTLDFNFSLGLIIQFSLAGLVLILTTKHIKNNCFKKPLKTRNDKKMLIFILLCPLFVVYVIPEIFNFLNTIIFFKVNIIVILIIGFLMLFIGTYISEK